jgi:hypothetical protein
VRKLLTLAAACLVCLVLPALPAAGQKTGPKPTAVVNLTGQWSCSDGGTYYLRQVNNTLWWVGKGPNGGKAWTNVFRGTIDELTVTGEWADLAPGANRRAGELTLELVAKAGWVVEIKRKKETGGFGGQAWTRTRGSIPPDDVIAARLGLTVQQVRQLRSQRGMPGDALASFPRDKVPVLLRRLANPRIQQDRAAAALLSLRNEKGVVPPGARARAILQVRAMGDKAAKGQRVAGLAVGPRTAPLRLVPEPGVPAGPGNWQSLGPREGVGGRTRALLIHPTNANILYAGAVGGGVWKSEDGGQSWKQLDDFLANLAVTCLVMHPTLPDVIYAGTGEGYGDLADLHGAGIFMTTDGGRNWTSVPGTNPAPAQGAAAPAAFQYVNRLAISPDGRALLAAVGKRNAQTADIGIYRMTVDDKGNASSPGTAPVWNRSVGCVAFHPTDSNQCVAGGLGEQAGAAIAYYSTKGGAADTWAAATIAANSEFNPTRQPRVELTYARARPTRIYASVNWRPDDAPVDPNTDPLRNGGSVWRSEDGGVTYERLAAKLTPDDQFPVVDTANGNNERIQHLGGQGWYDNVIWAGDANDPDVLVVGGVRLFRSITGGGLFKPISSGAEPSPHDDQHLIVAQPNNTNVVYVGNDGGIYKTDNVKTAGNDLPTESDVGRKQGWTHLVKGYVVTQFVGAAGHAPSGKILAGAQDNGTRRLTLGNPAWPLVASGDGGFCAIDQDDPAYGYGEYIYLAVFRTKGDAAINGLLDADNGYISGFFSEQVQNNDGAYQWNHVARDLPFRIPDAKHPLVPGAATSNFYAPFLLDPNNQKRLLAGGAKLWVTNDARAPLTHDRGPEWKDATAKKEAAPGDDNYISAIDVARKDSNVIWIGYNGGQLWKSGNGLMDQNSDWMPANANLPAGRMVTRITIDPNDKDRVFVTLGGYPPEGTAGNVWVLEGGMWKALSAGLPKAPARSLAIHPRKANWLYLATEVGVFVSDNNGQQWWPVNEGPSNCRVEHLFWMGETLVAATYGRGMFRVDLSKA